ncbi:MAG: hypothetical protein MZU95_13890 [Desulfomicrobium escambiense]|nr:hypothetical protein [Desulfomicrobium escambiense]
MTPKRWRDFEKLFGAHGAYGGCWCMWWRSTRREFEARKGEGNRLALKAIVDGGQGAGDPGLPGTRAGGVVLGGAARGLQFAGALAGAQAPGRPAGVVDRVFLRGEGFSRPGGCRGPHRRRLGLCEGPWRFHRRSLPRPAEENPARPGVELHGPARHVRPRRVCSVRPTVSKQMDYALFHPLRRTVGQSDRLGSGI